MKEEMQPVRWVERCSSNKALHISGLDPWLQAWRELQVKTPALGKCQHDTQAPHDDRVTLNQFYAHKPNGSAAGFIENLQTNVCSL